MRRAIAILNLAALSMVVVGTTIGADSAQANLKFFAFCKVLQTLCTKTNLVVIAPADGTFVARSPKARLLSGIIPVTCESTATLLSGSGSASNIVVNITALTWTSCTVCPTLTTTTLPAGELKSIVGDKATFLTTSQVVVLLKGCPFGAECTARASDVSMEFTGGTIGGTANLKANEVPVAVEGGALCGSSGKWDAGSAESSPYTITSVDGSTTGEIYITPETHT